MEESCGRGVASPSNLILVPLHHCPDLTASCAELLNQTWRRSLGARMHSLEQSSDDFPVCLVLVGAPQGPALGHARLCRVVGLPDSLFVESVVVSLELRGKGFGRKLMEATERYARGRGFQNLYLTTHDKQDFYYHLGYRLSESVQNMGTLGSLIPIGMFQKMAVTKASPNPPVSPTLVPIHLPSHLHTDQPAPVPQLPSQSLLCSTSISQPFLAPLLHCSTSSQPPPAPPLPSTSTSYPQPPPAPPLPSTSTSYPQPPPAPPQPPPAPPLPSTYRSSAHSPLAPPLLCSTCSYPPPAPPFSSTSTSSQPPLAPPLRSSSRSYPHPPSAPPLPSTSSPQPPLAPPLPSTSSPQPPLAPPLTSTSRSSQPPLAPPPLLKNTSPQPSSAPPPLDQTSEQRRTSSSLQTPYRDFRWEPIFWMKKCI